VPAGKLEDNETPEEAMVRELFEETGIAIHPITQLRSLGALYFRKPQFDYVYHMFQLHLDERPPVRLSKEHQHYTWALASELKVLSLMAGAYEAWAIYAARRT
jgi:8-oxo-dGTP pyrophosphatase MutT (NUDIX family)